MNKPSRVDIIDDIQAKCREYRRQLKGGEGALLETFLNSADAVSQDLLFQNLLHIDIEFRRRRGEHPSTDEYTKRFPYFARLIRQAFFESTMMSQENLGDTPGSADQTLKFGIPAARRLGEYELLRELGRGGFGVVYEAKHLQRGDRVALKTLPNITSGSSLSARDAERLHKFRHEFRSLSEVNHPNLAGMQTLEFDGDQWFFTMDLVNGVDFLDFVRPQGKLDVLRLRQTAKQLFRGVAALHEQGIVHRDLKPSNVLVDSQGHVTILDFGLVAELQQATDQTLSAHTRHFAGTPRYAAPEQADGGRNAACDWYALGVMLYEAATGEAPHTGSGVNLLLKKKTEDAPSLVGREGLPDDLANLFDQLLQRDPKQRPDFATIAGVLDLGSESTALDSSDTDQSTYSSDQESPLIGRDAELQSLDDNYRQFTESRQPRVVLVSGRSGEGKTTLVQKFLEQLRRDGQPLVLEGRCYDRESVPFKAMDTLVDALAIFLKSRGGDEIRPWMPDDVHLLAHLFPVLRRISSIENQLKPEVGGIDDRQLRHRAFFALRQILVRIGRQIPIVLFVDDLQWGDGDSAEVLFELLSPPGAPRVLFLGTYRSDEANDSSFLRELERTVENRGPKFAQEALSVEPLTQPQCVDLVASRLGIDPSELHEQAEELFNDTRGNPYFLEQLIEGFDAETRRFTPIPLDELIARKLERLPDQAAPLLEAIAVAGQAVVLPEASQVCGRPDNAFSTITHMRSEKLVRLVGSEDGQLVDTYHDKIREAVLAGLSDVDRRDLHVRFGETLEAKEDISAEKVLQFLDQDPTADAAAPPASDRIFDLAYHFHAANDPRGFAYQLMAGEQSYRAYASEDAVEFLRRCEACPPDDASSEIRYRLRLRHALSLTRLGQFSAAFMKLDDAFQVANNEMQRALVTSSMGDLHSRESKFESAVACYDQALDDLGYSRSQTRPMLLARTLRSLLLVHAKRLVRKCRTEQQRRQADAASRILNSVAWCEEIVANQLAFLEACTSVVVTAYRSGRPETIARSLTWLAWSTSFFSMHVAAKWYLSRAMQFAKQCESKVEIAVIDVYRAASIYILGRLDEAEETAKRASIEIEVLGAASSHRSMAIHVRRHIYFIQGNSRKEYDASVMELRIGESVGDRELICWAQYGLANSEARMGRLREAREHIQVCLTGYQGRGRLASRAVALHHLGFLELQSSDYPAAVNAFSEAKESIQQTFFYGEFAIRTYPWWIEALLGSRWTEGGNSKDIHRARRLITPTRFFAWRFPTIRPHSLRVFGRLACATWNSRKGIRYFEKSIASAEEMGARYDLARSLLDLAAVKEAGRESNRRKAIELLQSLESVIPHAESWQLGDQFDPSVVAPILEETQS